MAEKVIIVESPTKQKTISKFLDKSFLVKSSYGHIRDLPVNDLGVDINDGFKPKYVIIEKSKRIINEIEKAVKSCKIIYLATDPDREGEAISWHIMEVLSNIDRNKFKRIFFHEITKKAITDAIKNPRDIDFNLVNAQQARRILDRLVGYKLSPLLWDKIKKGLSAGRVQSVAVRLISERAREIENFKSQDYYTIKGIFQKGEDKFEAKLIKWEDKNVEETITIKLFAEDYKYKTSIFKNIEDTTKLINSLNNSNFFITNIEKKTYSQKPKPPFITSTLQQDSYNKLGFSSDRTMRTAQSLYEGVNIGGELTGLITYMRTDSFNVSKEMQEQTVEFIKKNFGDNYCPQTPPVYLKKVKGAQEAHEAIHPTDIYKTPDKIKDFLTSDQYKLYDLIWKRFIASQMSPAVYDLVSIEIQDSDKKSIFKANGRTIKFDGYLKVYKDENEEEDNEENEKNLPILSKGEKLILNDISPIPHKTSPPPYYNEASLIKILEKNGIGRPSTYATIISTIIERGYVRKEKDKRLMITELGSMVTEKLKEFFPEIMSLSYTADIEDKLDDIADGNIEWEKVIRNFYNNFSQKINIAHKEMKSEKIAIKTSEKCPICGSPMILRESKYGKYLSCSRFPKCPGKIQLDKDGNKINKLKPIKTGKKCSKCGKGEMLLRQGPRGFFLGCSTFPKCRNIEQISEEEVKKILGH